MTNTARYPCIFSTAVIGSSLVTAVTGAGCGGQLTDHTLARTVIVAECEQTAANADVWPELVVLDWTGGTNPIYPDHDFAGIDLSAFPTAEGGALADNAGSFREAVREEITRIYCDWPEVAILVRNAEDGEIDADTIVHLTQETPPNGGTDIGEAEYDPCNRQHDNAALIFGKRLRQLGGTYTLDEWVTVFANVCAHEIGHTLGYGHVTREDYLKLPENGYVELMLDRHTMAEMRQPQRFLADQTYCPGQLGRSRSVGDGVISCAGTDHQGEN